MSGRGTSVFDGQVIVHRTGPGAEAHQLSRNLLLSESANAYTKPHLEIDHEEVVASHGATVGALDEDALFYLRSRGVAKDAAEEMLTYAFIRDALDSIPHDATRSAAMDALSERLGEGLRMGALEQDDA